MSVIGRTRLPWEFALAAVAIYAASSWIVTMLESYDRPGLLAAGVTLDLTLLIPALYGWTCVRGRGWPWITLVPVFVLSVLLASWVIPSSHQQTLTAIEYALAPLELALIAFIGWKAHRAYRVFRNCRSRDEPIDPVDAIRVAAQQLVQVPWVARVVSYEISIFYLALFGWRFKVEPDPRSFTCYRDCSYGMIFAALSGVVLLELIGVHVLIYMWLSPTVAWVVTALSIYAALWMVGDFQALRLRPIAITEDSIRLRVGLRWEAEIPRSAIRELRPAGPEDEADVTMVVFGAPNLRLELDRSIQITGIYGFRREARSLLLAVDSPERFTGELERSRPHSPRC